MEVMLFVIWICLCDCGNKTSVKSSNLIGGITKSCGCLKEERILPCGEACFNRFYGIYQRNAKKKSLDFMLSKQEFKEITEQCCHYCGAKPTPTVSSTIKKITGTETYVSNGIDRIDNNKGYTINNVIPCCSNCNYAKRNRNYEEYLEWIVRSFNHLKEVGRV